MDAYLFDLDGTLIDSFEDIALSVNHTRRALGLAERPVPEIVSFVGEGARRLIERAVGQERPDLIDTALALWREHYDRHLLDRTRTYPGILKALARLPGFHAVVTNKPGSSARRLVQALGIGGHVQGVVGGGDVPSRKPDPEGCRLALASLPDVGRVVFVGDSVVDAQTARNGGFAFVGVLWGLGREVDLAAHGARVFAARPEELPEACARALGDCSAP